MKVKIDKYPALEIGKNGKLHFGGADLTRLAKEFGTPLYVVSEDVLRDSMRGVRDSFAKIWPDTLAVYATKAMSVKAVLKIAVQEGFWLDVASAGELHGAKSAGCPMANVLLHGNFKKAEELEQAVAAGVGRIVVDSYEEIETLAGIAAAAGKKVKVLMRSNPGVEAHTFECLKTGMLDSKFGFPIETGDAMRAVKKILSKKNLAFMGIHQHIGSQILDPEPFNIAAGRAMDFIASIKRETGADVKELDLGGGLPVRYNSEHPLPAPRLFANAVCSAVKAGCKEHGLVRPRLMIEPGRSIVGMACVTLYTVGPVKNIPDVRNYVAIDGGLSDNPRPVMYGATYEVLLANRPRPVPSMKTYRIVGRHCETDTMFDNIQLPPPAQGDTLAVLTTGAYNHSLANNYNKFTRPAMVLVSGKRAELIVSRENVEELYAHDIIPARLRAGGGKKK